MIRSLHVRSGTPGDLDFVKKCMKDLFKICLKMDEEPNFDKIFPYFDATYKTSMMNPKLAPVFIAEDNGRPVGCALCNVKESLEHGKKSLNLADLVVDRSARASGIGSILINHIVDYAEKNDFACIEGIQPQEGTEGSDKRDKFYQSRGFEKVGTGKIRFVNQYDITAV